MTKQEVSQILTIIQTEYPNTFAKLDKRQMQTKFEFWCGEFADDDFKAVFTALRQYINSGAEFAPNVGQLRAKMQMQQKQNEITAADAWSMVSKACRNGSYGYKKEFEKLPPIVQKAVGRAEQLREWAAMDETDVQTVIASNFKRDFRAVRERQREIDAYPQSLKNVINEMQLGSAKMDALPEGNA